MASNCCLCSFIFKRILLYMKVAHSEGKQLTFSLAVGPCTGAVQGSNAENCSSEMRVNSYMSRGSTEQWHGMAKATAASSDLCWEPLPRLPKDLPLWNNTEKSFVYSCIINSYWWKMGPNCGRWIKDTLRALMWRCCCKYTRLTRSRRLQPRLDVLQLSIKKELNNLAAFHVCDILDHCTVLKKLSVRKRNVQPNRNCWISLRLWFQQVVVG